MFLGLVLDVLSIFVIKQNMIAGKCSIEEKQTANIKHIALAATAKTCASKI